MLSIKPKPRSDAAAPTVSRRSERWFWPAVIAVLALGSLSAAWVGQVPPTGFTAAASDPTSSDRPGLHEHGFAALEIRPDQASRLL